MAAVELQSSPVEETKHESLGTVFRPHLRLESSPFDQEHVTSRAARQVSFSKPGRRAQVVSERSPEKQFGRPTILHSTIETDNKKRLGILKRNTSRYEPPSPDQLDPNSEVKSEVIRRMQVKLEVWDQQLRNIGTKKQRNDNLQRKEIEERDGNIEELTAKHTNECSVRHKIEQDRDQLQEQLTLTEADLEEHTLQGQQLQMELIQYQTAFQQSEERRQELEQENAELLEKLEQTETMKRRLNDQVTELQGQLVMEQRSQFCSIQ